MSSNKPKFEQSELTTEQKGIYRKVHEKPDLTLFMACVPRPTKEAFTKWADKEFGSGKGNTGHYGFALKHLWDFYQGALPEIGNALQQHLDGMESSFAVLSEKVSKMPSLEKVDIENINFKMQLLSDTIENLKAEMKEEMKKNDE